MPTQNSSGSRDKWLPEQKVVGQRIKSIAKANEIGLKQLHSELCKRKYPGITENEAAFEHSLNGRATSNFTGIVDAAADFLAEWQDKRQNKLNASTRQEVDLKKRELRHSILHGEDEPDLYELHELERRTKDAAIERLGKQAAKSGWKLYRYDWGDGLTNPDFNRRLLLSPPHIAVDRKSKEWLAHDYWDPDISGFAISAARGKSRHLSDDLKIRIASDFVGSSDVILQPTRYFSSLATDQISWSRFCTCRTKPDGTPERILWDGMSAFIDADGRLKHFDQCQVSNQLGASMMALTQDGEMLVVHQNKHNHQSVGRLAPSGSGSLDWADVGERTDLLDIARFGAKRELEEECVLIDPEGKCPAIGCEILLTGFVRMVHRAGKPEFYGIARIEGNADDICGRKPERYVEKVFNAPIEKANWNRPASPQIARMCRSYLELLGSDGKALPLSYPLQHLLNHLIEVCEDPEQAAVINAFMAQKI